MGSLKCEYDKTSDQNLQNLREFKLLDSGEFLNSIKNTEKEMLEKIINIRMS